MFSEIADYIETNAFQCTNKELFGIECFGCGIQRSFILLLRGDIMESIKMYPALIPLLLLVVFTIFHILFKIKNGHRVILILFIISTVIILTHFVLRQIELFT